MLLPAGHLRELILEKFNTLTYQGTKMCSVVFLDYDYDNNNNNINNSNNKFNLSSFTISEANYRLTLGYHGITSPFYTYKLHLFY